MLKTNIWSRVSQLGVAPPIRVTHPTFIVATDRSLTGGSVGLLDPVNGNILSTIDAADPESFNDGSWVGSPYIVTDPLTLRNWVLSIDSVSRIGGIRIYSPQVQELTRRNDNALSISNPVRTGNNREIGNPEFLSVYGDEMFSPIGRFNPATGAELDRSRYSKYSETATHVLTYNLAGVFTWTPKDGTAAVVWDHSASIDNSYNLIGPHKDVELSGLVIYLSNGAKVVAVTESGVEDVVSPDATLAGFRATDRFTRGRSMKFGGIFPSESSDGGSSTGSSTIWLKPLTFSVIGDSEVLDGAGAVVAQSPRRRTMLAEVWKVPEAVSRGGEFRFVDGETLYNMTDIRNVGLTHVAQFEYTSLESN